MKKADRRQVSLPRPSDYTKSFQKDWTALAASGRYDLSRLKEVMMLLIANEGPLGSEWKDHPLTGDWDDHRECHVGGDFLLVIIPVKPARDSGGCLPPWGSGF